MLVLNHFQDVLSKRTRPFCTVFPVGRDDAIHIEVITKISNHCMLSLRIRLILIDGYRDWYAKLTDVANVSSEIFAACLNGFYVLFGNVWF